MNSISLNDLLPAELDAAIVWKFRKRAGFKIYCTFGGKIRGLAIIASSIDSFCDLTFVWCENSDDSNTTRTPESYCWESGNNYIINLQEFINKGSLYQSDAVLIAAEKLMTLTLNKFLIPRGFGWADTYKTHFEKLYGVFAWNYNRKTRNWLLYFLIVEMNSLPVVAFTVNHFFIKEEARLARIIWNTNSGVKLQWD